MKDYHERNITQDFMVLLLRNEMLDYKVRKLSTKTGGHIVRNTWYKKSVSAKVMSKFINARTTVQHHIKRPKYKYRYSVYTLNFHDRCPIDIDNKKRCIDHHGGRLHAPESNNNII